MNEARVSLTHLQRLEAESIHIMREVVAECRQAGDAVFHRQGQRGDAAPGAQGVLSGARRRFRCCTSTPPGSSGRCIEFRDRMAREIGMELLVHMNPEAMARGINPFDHGSRCTPTSEDPGPEAGAGSATASMRLSAARGATRRRAAPRSASSRSARHSIAGTRRTSARSSGISTTPRKHKGESIRVFPLSNWTELDVWQYIHLEKIPIVPLYFAAPRPVVERDGT